MRWEGKRTVGKGDGRSGWSVCFSFLYPLERFSKIRWMSSSIAHEYGKRYDETMVEVYL